MRMNEMTSAQLGVLLLVGVPHHAFVSELQDALSQPEVAKQKQDDDYGTDKPDDVIHDVLLKSSPVLQSMYLDIDLPRLPRRLAKSLVVHRRFALIPLGCLICRR